MIQYTNSNQLFGKEKFPGGYSSQEKFNNKGKNWEGNSEMSGVWGRKMRRHPVQEAQLEWGPRSRHEQPAARAKPWWRLKFRVESRENWVDLKNSRQILESDDSFCCSLIFKQYQILNWIICIHLYLLCF